MQELSLTNTSKYNQISLYLYKNHFYLYQNKLYWFDCTNAAKFDDGEQPPYLPQKTY